MKAAKIEYPAIYHRILSNMTHGLIAGCTGSGKSTIIHALILSQLARDPDTSLYLIDFKRVELSDYCRIRQRRRYAETAEQADKLLAELQAIMRKRYRLMKRKQYKLYPSKPVFLVIDEFAEMLINCGRSIIPPLQSILQLGRAANIHVIIATQQPLASVIPTTLKCNLDTQIALRTKSAQDSRNIIGLAGAEKLPRYGSALYNSPATMSIETINLPLFPAASRNAILKAHRTLI